MSDKEPKRGDDWGDDGLELERLDGRIVECVFRGKQTQMVGQKGTVSAVLLVEGPDTTSLTVHHPDKRKT